MSKNYEVRVDTTSTANIVYVGKTAVGKAGTDTAAWQISKIDITSGVIIEWADGDDLFDNIWDNRTTLTYV